MKPFQTILFLTVIILIGGMAALYWGKTVDEVTKPIEVVEETTEPAEEELAPGMYLVFQTSYVSDPGEKDWANDDTETYTFYRVHLDDIGEDEPVSFVQVVHPSEIPGALTSYTFGQYVLMHRYLHDNQDGMLTLNGDVIETREEDWGRTRSENGRYEVTWDSPYDDANTGITVTDLESKKVVAQIDERIFELSNERWELDPFLIDNNGEWVYFREACGCEAQLSGLWQYEVATTQVTRLDTILDLTTWSYTNIEPETRMLLSVETVEVFDNEGPGPSLVPPTTIRLLDLDSLEITQLLTDDERAWDSSMLDPEGADRYILRNVETHGIYLVGIGDETISEDQYVTSGWLKDWVGDWIVVQDTRDQSLRLVSLTTGEEVLVELEGERVNYIGAIVID